MTAAAQNKLKMNGYGCSCCSKQETSGRGWGEDEFVKQGIPPNVWAKVELEVVAVSNMPDAEIVVRRFAMDDEIYPWGQVVIDQYLRFGWKKTSIYGRKRR
ncbi:hypothetical protein V6N12_019866 [Hibiscus sabdariffa]|uniref:Uncharacterized protein n=1 Tax=Hibiscus sabdariffa TaxID=183260 RepID=A0ABR2B2U2_9ROSI